MREELFDAVRTVVKDHIELESEAEYDLLACWAIGTWVFDVFPTYPYLYISGPPGSGKSKTLELLNQLCRRPYHIASISTAALYRVIEAEHPTLLLDELERLSSERMEETRLILQSGYKKGGKVIRMGGKDKMELQHFDVYGPKAMASIKFPDIVFASRCIQLTMSKSINPAFANKKIEVSPVIKNMLAQLENDVELKFTLKSLQIAYENGVQMPKQIIGREREMWEPIFALAHCPINHEGMMGFARIVDYSLAKCDENMAEQQTTLLADYIREFLAGLEGREALILTSAEIAERMTARLGEEIKTRSVPYQMRQLKIGFVVKKGKKEYYITREFAKKLAQRFMIKEDVNEPAERPRSESLGAQGNGTLVRPRPDAGE